MTSNQIPDSRPVSFSQAEQAYLIMPQHINGYGRLFGGMLMQWMDQLAGIVARRHSGQEVTTAVIDQLEFKAAAELNETCVLVARVTYVGTTSMEVRVDNFAENFQGIRRPITRAYFVMVAIDMEGKPQPVPRLTLETPQQEAEWTLGERRYRMRRERKREGY